MADPSSSPAEMFHRLGQFFQGLTLNQRLLLAGGGTLVGGVIWIFVALLGQPKYVTLYSGLRTEESQNLASRLAAKNISYQIAPDGSSLLVPEDKLDASRLETAAAGLPRTARLGFELFDSPNWAGSDFTEKVNYQRALEGELERTLATLSEIEAVRVHLVMPEESLFTEREHEAKAAVIVKTRGGRLSDQAHLAIPQLVASAVDRLRPENVTVVDAASNTPLLRDSAGPGSRTYRVDDELAQTLVHTLEPVVGADHVRASVHVEYELGTTEATDEIYDPKAQVPLTQEHAEENSNGTTPAGIPGTASNVPSGTTAPATNPTAEQASSRSDSTTYAVSKSVRHSTEPPGRVRRIAAAVLVDDAVEYSDQSGKRMTTRRKRTADEIKQIEQLAQAAIGIDSQRGDVLAVENLSFQQTPPETLPAPTKIERWRGLMQPWSWVLRYVGLALLFVVVYALVLRPVKKQALTAFRELPGRVRSGALSSDSGKSVQFAEGQITAGGAEKDASHLKSLLIDKVKAEPEAASRLVRSWIEQGAKS